MEGIIELGLYDCICVKRDDVIIYRTRGIHLLETARTVKSPITGQLWFKDNNCPHIDCEERWLLK